MTTLHRAFQVKIESLVLPNEVSEVTNGRDRSHSTLCNAGMQPGPVSDLLQAATMVLQGHQLDVSGVG